MEDLIRTRTSKYLPFSLHHIRICDKSMRIIKYDLKNETGSILRGLDRLRF